MQKKVNLSKYTSFKVGGPATEFTEATSPEEMAKAIAAAVQSGRRFFVLGGGTNTLFTDHGYDGVVIRNAMRKITLHTGGIIVAETGASLAEINVFANRHGLVGFEKMATVPGTLGGGLYNNAHWLDNLLSDFVVSVDALKVSSDGSTENVKLLQPHLHFGYDHSIFREESVVALSATLQLREGDTAASRAEFLGYLKKRSEMHPYGTMNCGCMFQNVKGNIGPGHGGTTSAGYLIDQCGLKGTKIGGAQISEKHANFFINTGAATSADIEALVKLCQDRVRSKFGVDLELEVHVVE